MNDDEFPACAECGHRAWAHGTQTGHPANGETCHAAMEASGRIECGCPGGYRYPGAPA